MINWTYNSKDFKINENTNNLIPEGDDRVNIRTQLRTKSIYDLPLRVTYYARVSSDSDEQLNSLDNQVN